MKIWDIDYTADGKEYRDNFSALWKVQEGTLKLCAGSNAGLVITNVYSLGELAMLSFVEVKHVDWEKIEPNTPVLVSPNGEDWFIRHFAEYKDDRAFTHDAGLTSFTNGNNSITNHRYIQLAADTAYELIPGSTGLVTLL